MVKTLAMDVRIHHAGRSTEPVRGLLRGLPHVAKSWEPVEDVVFFSRFLLGLYRELCLHVMAMQEELATPEINGHVIQRPRFRSRGLVEVHGLEHCLVLPGDTLLFGLPTGKDPARALMPDDFVEHGNFIKVGARAVAAGSLHKHLFEGYSHGAS